MVAHRGLQPELTPRELYEECGVIATPGLLSATDIDLVAAEVVSYIDSVAPTLPNGFSFYEPGGGAVRSLHWMNARSDFFASLCEDARLVAAVGEVVPWEPVPHSVELFAKAANVGSRVVEHQEEPFLFIEPAEFCTLWLALDEVNAANGPVEFYVGSQKLGVLPHEYRDLEGTLLAITDLDPLEGLATIAFELQPGDATIHHPRTVHFSEPNTSGYRRMGLAFVFRSKTSTVNDGALQNLVGLSWNS